MMNFRICFLLLAVFFTFDAVSQIDFVPSYFIDKNDNRVECLIKDRDWLNNPDSIYYMLDDSTEMLAFGIQDVSEFQVSSSKYVRYATLIDQSSVDVEALSESKKPEFEEKTVFLKVLLEGEKSLLHYQYDGLSHFFIESDGVLTPLISRAYKLESGQVRQHDAYKGQLIATLGVDETIRAQIHNCGYYEKSLLGVFELYHQITCDECVTYKNVRNHVMFLSPLLGVDVARLHPQLGSDYGSFDISVVNACIGVELEYMLPFNNTMWSLFTDPTMLISSKNQTEFADKYGEKIEASFDYNYLKIPLGFRYHNHLSEDLEWMVGTSVYYTYSWNSPILLLDAVDKRQRGVEFHGYFGVCFALSCGMRYHDFVAKVGFNGFNHKMIQVYTQTQSYELSNYKSISLSLAYRFQISE